MADKDDNGGQSFEDRREHTRYDTSIAVDYASGETFLFAYLANISEMGIFVRTNDPLEVGTQLRLRFHVDQGEPLVIAGEVTWINPYIEGGENLNPGMGVRFIGLTPELREQVVALVRTVAYLRDEDPGRSN
ncbi:MAG: TIGR02266 family protein [Myxococcales bacterium]|jgi:type IV pilus assembly protein PilZ